MRPRHLLIPSLAALALGLHGGLLMAVDGSAPAAEASLANSAPISIECSDKPLETVLQWISRRAGVNIVCNEQDQPRITLRLVNVTWQEAVEQISAKYDLVIDRKSDRIWVLSRPPKVRMEFQDARLVVILEALARQANVNIVIGDDVDSGKRLTMTLNGVPWKEALDVIVKTTGYAWIEQDYHIIRVVTPDKLQKDLVTRIYHLNYITAAQMQPLLAGSLSKDGKILSDPRSNNIIITDTVPALDAVARIINTVDSRTREVLIEMKFVEFDDSDAQRIGFNPVTLNFDLERLGQVSAGFSPASSATGTAGFSGTRDLSNIPTTSGNYSGNLAFEAITSLQSTQILQTPQLLTIDTIAATITIGRELHFAEETVSNENNSIVRSLKEAASSPVTDGIKISVTPHITSDGFVQIALDASNDDVTLEEFSDKANPDDPNGSQISLPQKNTTKITTSIMCADGRTGVIGGLLNNQNVEGDTKVPLLGEIPVFGWLFRDRSDSITRRNLTIFITPHIVPLAGKTEYEQRYENLRQDLSGQKPGGEGGSGIPAPAPAAPADDKLGN